MSRLGETIPIRVDTIPRESNRISHLHSHLHFVTYTTVYDTYVAAFYDRPHIQGLLWNPFRGSFAKELYPVLRVAR
jgi:hypothetical protein